MNPMATGVAAALISGVAMYTVGTKAAQLDTLTQNAASVQAVDGSSSRPPTRMRCDGRGAFDSHRHAGPQHRATHDDDGEASGV